jgi:hypothetical protein
VRPLRAPNRQIVQAAVLFYEKVNKQESTEYDCLHDQPFSFPLYYSKLTSRGRVFVLGALVVELLLQDAYARNRLFHSTSEGYAFHYSTNQKL